MAIKAMVAILVFGIFDLIRNRKTGWKEQNGNPGHAYNWALFIKVFWSPKTYQKKKEF